MLFGCPVDKQQLIDTRDTLLNALFHRSSLGLAPNLVYHPDLRSLHGEVLVTIYAAVFVLE